MRRAVAPTATYDDRAKVQRVAHDAELTRVEQQHRSEARLAGSKVEEARPFLIRAV
jgi:hypothetical protein